VSKSKSQLIFLLFQKKTILDGGPNKGPSAAMTKQQQRDDADEDNLDSDRSTPVKKLFRLNTNNSKQEALKQKDNDGGSDRVDPGGYQPNEVRIKNNNLNHYLLQLTK
jgi:hypothetical protein